MKKNVLQIVQGILSSMDSDEVNSISDTPESLQVANILQDSFYEVISRANLPEHYKLFELNAATLAKPTMMTPPDNVHDILWIKYDTKAVDETIPEFSYVKPLEVDEFFDYTYNFDSTDAAFESYTHTIGSDSIKIFCYNDLHPRFYTVLQDDSIIFDSYDSTVETNLQKTNSLAYGFVTPLFSMTDTYTPEIDENMFPLLINEAKRQAFIELKQTQNPVAEQRARRHWVRSQKVKENIKTGTTYSRYPNYSRK